MDPVIVNCPPGYQCKLVVEAVWTAEQQIAVLAASVGIVALIIILIIVAWSKAQRR